MGSRCLIWSVTSRVFHCQQSIEKNLKAYLIFLDIEFKPVHDLGYLMNLIGTKVDVLDPYYNRVDKISRYAVQIRYPDAIIKLTRAQIEEAINLTVLLADLIKKKIGVNPSHTFRGTHMGMP